ncbi:DUF977 family protein [Raoultella sp. Lac2]|uniref:DUF977 family protein n=1 Tax=unclassified Raoultella TaxID=2627600 RepID=UPI0013528F6C|nr:DUF977 family protein [Raoultella sp. Lac2]MXF99255.1 DUF977 family protein [Raoultella sp. Lac1]
MDTLKQRIIDFIKQNQPVTEKEIMAAVGISRYLCREERRRLRTLRAIYIVSGAGTFICRADYESWFRNGGMQKMQEKIAAAREIRHQEKADVYRPKRETVIESYMKSPARQRLMAIYGRSS